MTKNTDFETVGAMHQCKKGEMFSTCAHCGAMAGKLNSPCPQYMRNAAAAMTKAAPVAPAVGNSGFDYKTAADLLNGKTVRDEAIRKFVAASRWAHDDSAGLRATLISARGELASREAEIALLKKTLMDAEPAPQPAVPTIMRWNPLAGWGMKPAANGLYVRYEDHAAALAAAPKADHIADASKMVPAPPQQGEYLPTGNPEADRVLGRLNSSDPDFDDCAEAAALIYKMVTEAKCPDGFATWKDAAIAARGAAQAAPAPVDKASTPDGTPCNVELRGLWYSAGGYFHGPTLESATMPEALLLPFLRSLLSAPPAPVAEDEIRKALDDAATALETISRIAGRDQYMLGMMDVRLYAAARAKAAREAQAAQPEGGANANR